MGIEDLELELVKVSWVCFVCKKLVFATPIEGTDELEMAVPGSCCHPAKCFKLAEAMMLAPAVASDKYPRQ